MVKLVIGLATVVILGTIAILAIAVALVVVAVRPAAAHSWYSTECCNRQDCRQAQKGEVAKTAEGWRISPSDRSWIETVPFDSSIIHPSQDVNFHICLAADKLRCVYKPDPGT